MRFDSLSAKDRLQLLRFVCASMWADLEIGSSEKTFVLGLAQRLNLSSSEIEQVQAWLETPAPPEDVDPASIPPRHRHVFLEAVEQALAADGTIHPSESEHLALFRELLR